ncbi:alpha/beta hydrolase [Chryseobacterium tructae]|uniref:Alpha/beta fold hydrolase n=1 Tax=Chryseobacterium tructae TaxID=1037380 RepID=A0ABV7Y2N6_9FLAO|nr:alpha/beta hydrolase [Chryseobacterium tructae]MDN3694766.1 alpha/beta hydrolase [Chryseobacterium tructae]
MNHIAKINGVDLCYEILGAEHQQTIVLISGLGSQMIRWDDPFCQLWVQQGFRVIRFDNRDSGISVFHSENPLHFTGNYQTFLSNMKAEDIPYSLLDMTKDVTGLLDYLQIDKAHFVGRSMGGIIAQLLGSYYPERVLSLTIIMSTSLNPALPSSNPEVMAMMMKPPVDPIADKEGYIKDKLFFAKRISGDLYKLDENLEIEMIEEELNRSTTKDGIIRQLLAIATYQYDQEVLTRIKIPTLVIHGSQDPIFHLDCGKDIADCIPDAQFMLIEGMGHSIPQELYSSIFQKITGLTSEIGA